MKDGYAIVKRLKSGDVVPTGSMPVDLIRTATGALHVSTSDGPKELVHAANINSVLASAGGAGWEKVQIASPAYQLKPATSGASRDFHIEAGGDLAILEVADWPIPTSPNVDVFKIRNFSDTAVTFEVGAGYSGLVTADDNPSTPAADSYSIRNDGMVVVSIDSDGWVQVVPSAEVSQAELDSGLAGKANTVHAHTGTYEPANTNIQTHVAATHAPATAEENVQSDWNVTSGDALILNKPASLPASYLGSAIRPQEKLVTLQTAGAWSENKARTTTAFAGDCFVEWKNTGVTLDFGFWGLDTRAPGATDYMPYPAGVYGISANSTSYKKAGVDGTGADLGLVKALNDVIRLERKSNIVKAYINGTLRVTWTTTNSGTLYFGGTFVAADSGIHDIRMGTFAADGADAHVDAAWEYVTAVTQTESNFDQPVITAPMYADNAAAKVGGVILGDTYRTTTGQLMVRY